jgi:hypothetical protein
MHRQPVSVPDTGTTRGDLIALLQQLSKNRSLLVVFVSLQMGEYFSETNTSIADLRKHVLGGFHHALDLVFQRSVDRGEIDRRKLTPRIAALLPDLLRHELLMTLRPVPEAALAEMVDEVFLPLIGSKASHTVRSRPGNLKTPLNRRLKKR